MASVFLSYSSKDNHLADKVEAALEAHGHQVWRDKKDIQVGQLIPEEVSRGLKNCDYLAVIVTKNSENNEWVRREVCNYMMKSGFTQDSILPLRFEAFPPDGISLILQSNRWADFSVNFTEGLNDVRRRLGTPTKTDTSKAKDFKRRDFAIDLALRAGSVAMRFYNSCLEENRSVDDRKNAATLADKAAHKELMGALLNHRDYRDDGLISEEMMEDSPVFKAELDKEYTWVVDPLDGTTNFQNRIPFFCTAIGVLRNRQPYIGVVYDPVANEVYYALDGEQSQVWRVSLGEVSDIKLGDENVCELSKCLVGTHISSRREVAERLFKDNYLLHIEEEVKNIRALGSGQLALAYVATSRIQLFFQLESHLWDQVAGIVLIRNAGGIVSDLRNRIDWNTETKDILAASNPQIHSMFISRFARR